MRSIAFEIARYWRETLLETFIDGDHLNSYIEELFLSDGQAVPSDEMVGPVINDVVARFPNATVRDWELAAIIFDDLTDDDVRAMGSGGLQ